MSGRNRRKQPEPSFLSALAVHATIWGSRHGVGEALDRYFGLYTPSLSSGLSQGGKVFGLATVIGAPVLLPVGIGIAIAGAALAL